jgi:hypothetical protein
MKIAAAALTAVFAVVTTVAVKSFKALLTLGEEFNEVTRIIRVGTGAVGGDLAALEQSFRNVAAAGPAAFADVAAVIAELDTRTDLAGDGLEVMAEQLLTLSRLMGGDARTTTREVTRLFNRFGLEAEESADMLDLLFRAAQASGAQVDRLAADVTKNAGALIGMGLSLEESVALFALFEREGIRAETVVRSLRSAFGKLTADGTPLKDALADVFTELQTLDREAAVAKGLEIFGSQALDLVDAVRDGRLSVEDFTKQLVEGQDTILGVAEETDGWRQALDTLRNNLKLAFEPAAREVFRQVTGFVDELIPAANRVAEAFEKDGLQGALKQVSEEWDRIYTERLQPLFLRLLEFLQETVKPIALEIGREIGGAIAAGISNAAADALRGLGKRLLDSVLRQAGGEQFGFFGFEQGGGSRSVPQIAADLGVSIPSPAPRRPSVPPSRAFTLPPGLTMFASGGIVTSPTLGMVGEAGPEAIIPLDRAGSLGSTIVNVTVTSADPQAVVEAIRRYTRSNGPLRQVVNI